MQASIRNVVLPFSEDPLRSDKLMRLGETQITKVAEQCIERVLTALTSVFEDIDVHLFPTCNGFGGGCTISPGKILVTATLEEDLAPIKLQRTITHEYSHCVRMTKYPQATEHGFGDEIPYSVRDYLVFEGLAMVLSDEVYPTASIPNYPYPVTDEMEEAWWRDAQTDMVGPQGYIKHMNLRGYEISRRIVSHYLDQNNATIFEAHGVPGAELYWQSGYSYLR